MKNILLVVAAAMVSVTALSEKVKMDPKDLLTRIHDINQEEIAAGTLAARKAKSDKVKKYGDQLIKDHTRADRKVMDLARQEGIDVTSSMPTSGGEAKQAAQKTATLSELKLLSGAKFDKAFVAAMEKGHDDTIAMLESADISDAKVERLVKALLPELKEHKHGAQKLVPITEGEAH